MQPTMSPPRWDYRPAWSMATGEGQRLSVDDLPAAAAVARARQQDGIQAHIDSGQPPRCATASAGLHAAGDAGQQQQLEEQQPPQAPPNHLQQQWQQLGHAALPPAAPAFLYPAAVMAAPGSPTGGAVIHQYFAAPHAARVQPQQQQLEAATGPADTDWCQQSRPGSAGSSYSLQWQAAAYPLAGPALLAPLQAPLLPGGWAQVTGKGPASPAAHQQGLQTPGTGLASERLAGSMPAGSTIHVGATAARPSSASAREKPLAVPPGQVDEGALAAARAEYVREKERIRAKRLRELQESADLKLR